MNTTTPSERSDKEGLAREPRELSCEEIEPRELSCEELESIIGGVEVGSSFRGRSVFEGVESIVTGIEAILEEDLM